MVIGEIDTVELAKKLSFYRMMMSFWIRPLSTVRWLVQEGQMAEAEKAYRLHLGSIKRHSGIYQAYQPLIDEMVDELRRRGVLA